MFYHPGWWYQMYLSLQYLKMMIPNDFFAQPPTSNGMYTAIDAVVVGYRMSILWSISFGSNPALLSVFIQCALLVNCCDLTLFLLIANQCLLVKPQLAVSVFTQLLLVELPSLLLMSLICVGLFYHVLLVKTRMSLVGKISDKCHMFSGSFQPPQSCMLKPQLPWLKQSSLDDFPIFFPSLVVFPDVNWHRQAYRWAPLALIRASAAALFILGARFMSWLKSWENFLSMVNHWRNNMN